MRIGSLSKCGLSCAQGAIKWADEVDDFPFRTGFVTVVIAW